MTRRALVVRIAGPDGIGPCLGTVRARGGGSAQYDVGAGRRGKAKVRLTRAERRALARKGAVQVQVRSKLGPGDVVERSGKLRLGI